MTRLTAATLPAPLPYDRAAVTPGIVHLGIGAFHRAHMAVYVDDLLARDPRWGIVGASLRRPDTRDALAPQDFLYTVAIRDASGTTNRVIGSILDILDANTQRAELIAMLADPRIRIVSLTVTEKGYCHDPATGKLDPNHPDIVHDLANPEAPVSAPGLIVRAIELRRAGGIAPFTVMSCDNLPANGRTTRRIVTGSTDADREAMRAAAGYDDAWPIMTEPFTQWVIEDNFASGRPAFELAGAQLVDDVEPFELMKLRMLNGSHSTMAYLGYLAGYQYVNEAVDDPAIHKLIRGLMTEEAMPTLPMDKAELGRYRDQLLARFANPALKHRTWQIAMDGSQKLPQRLLGTITDRLADGQPVNRLALGVAAWMRYVTGIDEQGNPIEVKDPLAARCRAIADAAGRDATKLADGLLAIPEIFGTNLPANETFRATVTAHLASLLERGARATVSAVAG
jgi:fructuronate reductase